jgi:hypothetical protein
MVRWNLFLRRNHDSSMITRTFSTASTRLGHRPIAERPLPEVKSFDARSTPVNRPTTTSTLSSIHSMLSARPARPTATAAAMVHRCEVGYASRSPVAYFPPFFLRRGSHARLVPFLAVVSNRSKAGPYSITSVGRRGEDGKAVHLAKWARPPSDTFNSTGVGLQPVRGI